MSGTLSMTLKGPAGAKSVLTLVISVMWTLT